MSTEISNLKVRNGRLSLTQFFAGKEGLCLQFYLTPDTDSIYTELTKPQVQQLVRELQNWLGETELPWDKATQEHYEELEAELGRLRLQIHNLYAYSKRHTDS